MRPIPLLLLAVPPAVQADTCAPCPPAVPVMKEEIATTMRLLGVRSLDELRPEMVRFVDREPAPLAGWRGGQQ